MARYGYDNLDISEVVESASNAALKRMVLMRQAETDVKPIVGDLVDGSCKSAEDVYRFCLERCGVDITGVDPAAFRAMVRLLNGDGSMKNDSNAMAADSAATTSFHQRFPNVARVKKV